MEYVHTMVRVTDVEKSLAFYCGLLGLKEMSRTVNEKGRFTLIFLAAPGDEERCDGGAETGPAKKCTFSGLRKRNWSNHHVSSI